MGLKFDMGSQTLSTLSGQTQGSSEDLGALVKQLVAAAEPLEGKFNGAGKAAFDNFKQNSDGIAASLNSALRSVLGGQKGMDRSFIAGEHEAADNARQSNVFGQLRRGPLLVAHGPSTQHGQDKDRRRRHGRPPISTGRMRT